MRPLVRRVDRPHTQGAGESATANGIFQLKRFDVVVVKKVIESILMPAIHSVAIVSRIRRNAGSLV